MKVSLFLISLLVASVGWAGEAEYLLKGGSIPARAASNGYQQEVRQLNTGEILLLVTTTLAPINATGPYADVSDGDLPEVPEGFELPVRLRKELRPDMDAWEAATLVLEWTANRVVLDSSDSGPQDAISVLGRRRGRCSGLANASVALLRTAGFEARTVSGLLIGEDGPIPHRWLECRFPGAGWVPSDPTLGLWAITPRHLTYADTVTRIPEVRMLRGREDELSLLPRYKSRVYRPNYGADLVCRLSVTPNGAVPVAVLRRAGGEVRRARLDPEAHFSGLLPGRWLLEIEAGGAVVERQELNLDAGGVNSILVADTSERRTREVGS